MISHSMMGSTLFTSDFLEAQGPRALGPQGPGGPRDPHLPSGGGPLRRHELLRIWAVCPPEKLPQLDVALSEAAKRGGIEAAPEIWGHFFGGKPWKTQ